MTLDHGPRERSRLARVIGIVLVIAGPALAYGTWWSTRQPLEMLAWTELNRRNVPPEQYGSAVYMAANAQQTLDEKWTLTGFATLGTAAFLVGSGLLFVSFRRSRLLAVSR